MLVLHKYTATTELYTDGHTLCLHVALPIARGRDGLYREGLVAPQCAPTNEAIRAVAINRAAPATTAQCRRHSAPAQCQAAAPAADTRRRCRTRGSPRPDGTPARAPRTARA